MRRPTEPLFSGWNCVAMTRPRCTALQALEHESGEHQLRADDTQQDISFFVVTLKDVTVAGMIMLCLSPDEVVAVCGKRERPWLGLLGGHSTVRVHKVDLHGRQNAVNLVHLEASANGNTFGTIYEHKKHPVSYEVTRGNIRHGVPHEKCVWRNRQSSGDRIRY